MLSALVTRAERIGAARRREAIGRLAAAIRDAAPDRQVAADDDDGVTVTGRGVLDDPRLRWIGSLLR